MWGGGAHLLLGLSPGSSRADAPAATQLPWHTVVPDNQLFTVSIAQVLKQRNGHLENGVISAVLSRST